MIAPASRKIGKYEIVRKLGRGGMADVYLAQDTENGGTVALKLIEHSTDADTVAAIEAERRGAELQAHLAAIDPRVVRVYGAGDADGFFYVAMEYIDGQDLAELMRRGPLVLGFATEVAAAVAKTLDNAHNLEIAIGGKDFRGVVHGDIKPKNIRIDAHGEVRVLDFGIAKALSMSRKLTRNEFGSVPYASPERLDLGEVNVGSDLWSLAVMLYEMVTGMQPYHADNTERLERMIRSRIAPPPAPDPCPEPLRRILIKAMAPNPALRYPSAREFCADLEAFRAGTTVAAASEDLDATRRTFRPGEDAAGDETRRTAASDATRQTNAGGAGTDAKLGTDGTVHAPQKARLGTVSSVPSAAYVATMRVLLVLLLAGVLYGGWVLASNYLLYQHGQQLAREVEAEQITDLDQIWSRWTELSKGNASSLLLHGPRKVVKQKFVAAVDHVIDTYRNNESQLIYEKDWEGARTMASRALAVDPEDSVRGKLRLSEGHLARINGTSHRSAQELNLAVEKFDEAQKLLPKSPDPELGLARVYVYGLKDIDKGYEALQEAQKRGYQLGNREKLLLADGYRDRADRLWWDSRNVRGLAAEKDQIQKAADDYKRAEELYQGISPWGKSIVNLVRVRLSLESVNFRLGQIASDTH
ncbi:MAG: serine/threonine-protein kinase [Candidatus Solibacter sp.]|jgi:tetratricopeptide (TPR) repeat protein/predicted Ser/Thr protein kinase